MDGELGVIVISDDESNDNMKEISGNSETAKDAESNKSGIDNFTKTCILNNFVEQAILSDGQDRQLNKNQSDLECEKKEDMNSLLVLKNDETDHLKGISDTLKKELDDPESSPSLNWSTSCSNSFDKDFDSEVYKNRKSIHKCKDEDLGESHSDNLEASTVLNSFVLSSCSIGCERLSESTKTSTISSEKAILEHKNTEVEDSEILKSSNHSVHKDIFYHKEIENAALCSEFRIKNFSLEHLNVCTPDNEQGSTSEIKCEVISEKKYTSDVPAVTDTDLKKLKYSCPLCWKIVETSQLQMAHMKECAVRHNLSTRQLLNALELQEKQSAERSALGLPDIPTTHMMKKSTAKRKRGGGNDDNLQLALALSVSLQEAEDKEQLEEDECLIEAGLGREVAERQKTMLERFGFTNSRPAIIPSANSKLKQGSKNKNKNTVLTQRTKEERERLTTEKVAIILIGEENSSSVSVENAQVVENSVGVMSSLQKYEVKCNSLWGAVTSSWNEEQNLYVRELSNLISPCKVKAGEKNRHLSQEPGQSMTPARTEAAANDERFHASSSSQAEKQLGNESECLSVESKTRKSLQGFFTEKDKSNNRLAETLITDWRAILNKKAMSDVKIFVESEQEIPGHKLVFYVRCRSILRDIIIEKGSEKSISVLMWIDISYRAALAFLQFIYCGLTSKILRLDEKDMLAVEELAQRYRVTELKDHLKVMSRVRAKVSKQYSSESSEFHSPSKCFSPPKYEHTPQNDGLTTGFSQRYSQYDISLSDESIPFQKDKLSAYSSLEHKEKCKSVTTSPKNCMFSNSDQEKQSSRSQFSSKSSHILDNIAQQLNKVGTDSVSSEIKNEINMNSPSLKQDAIRSASPDLFMEAESEENINGLSQESGVNIRYLLDLFDICLTQNNQQTMSQQNSNSSSPKVSQNKNSSPVQRTKSLSSSPVEENINNSHESTVNPSKTSLEHTTKTNDSANEKNKDILSLLLDSHTKTHSSAKDSQIKSIDIKNVQPVNDSKATKNVFDCVNFLENLISDSSTKDMKSEGMDSKRRYSSSGDSYRPNIKKVCRKSPGVEVVISSQKVDPIDLSHCKTDEYNVIDTLDLTENSNKSDYSQLCPTLNHKADISYDSKSCSEKGDICDKTSSNRINGCETTGSDIKNLELRTVMTTAKSGTDNTQYQDDWDSFDEMCNASDPEIFSQDLNKLLLSQSVSSNSGKHTNRNSAFSMPQKQLSDFNLIIKSPHRRNNQKNANNKVSLEDTLMACLNESVLWRDENAPSLNSVARDRKSALLREYHKTPTQQKNVTTENVTPPANYSTMKTPELKKELDRYGLKPSLTKKQAKIMLRYIYDKLHPFITVSDSEDGENDLPPSPFKIPDKNTHVPKSPRKKVNNSGVSTGNKKNGKNQVSVRRSLTSQIDCDELSSQESSSSSTADVAEEILFEDLEEFDKEISGSQNNVLASVVQHYIAANPQLHQKVLQHEPVWIEEFLNELKAQNHKFKMNQLMDYFDEQCITFRTLQTHRRRQKKGTRKKKSPAKKGKLSNIKSATSSTPSSPNSSYSS